MIPAGYGESLESSTNRIQDPDLHGFYDQLRVITRGHRSCRAIACARSSA